MVVRAVSVRDSSTPSTVTTLNVTDCSPGAPASRTSSVPMSMPGSSTVRLPWGTATTSTASATDTRWTVTVAPAARTVSGVTLNRSSASRTRPSSASRSATVGAGEVTARDCPSATTVTALGRLRVSDRPSRPTRAERDVDSQASSVRRPAAASASSTRSSVVQNVCSVPAGSVTVSLRA